ALAEASAQQAVLSRRSALAAAEARVAKAANTLDRSRIALEEAQRRLAETEVRAPFSGTLSGVTLVEGRLITSNEQIATLVDPTALEVSFRLSTAQYARLLDAGGTLTRAEVTVRLAV
ncbi:MAG: HlyD family efflux transporter periplasmic adaptor subunit, partial [Maritimibacter sp.]|nr:HlyD family efflux transporter periplasmic adaptor subunit [Maritimibacter sp.]